VNNLMIAPQPVFSPRGTPISVVNRCRALSALGHTVDLVTYPLGENVEIDGVRWLRAPRIPGIRSVKIGPSAAKLPLDAAVLATATARAVSTPTRRPGSSAGGSAACSASPTSTTCTTA